MTLIETATGKHIRSFLGDEGMTLGLAPSPDGRYFISGSTDQRIRIWSPDRDEPVLSIFVADREWIAWTPEGYYTCSAYGERLIAWQVNNGIAKLPTLHPAVRFHASMFQPTLIQYLIPAGNLQLAMAMAQEFEQETIAATSVAEVLPPDVSVAAPGEGLVRVTEEKLTVRAIARGSARNPVTAMRLIVNGRPFQGQAGIVRFEKGKVDAEAEWNLEIDPGSFTLEVQAESAVSKGMSRPVVVVRSGSAVPPNLYVLAVGVSEYPAPMRLNFAASDTELLTVSLKKNCKGVFGNIEVRVLTDEKATKQGILDGLTWLASKMTTNDVGIFSFSGHGTRDRAGRFYLVPVDISEDDPAGTCLAGDVFRHRLENMPGKLIAVLDACHSGAASTRTGGSARADGLVRDLVSDDCGVVVMCSSLGREYSMESSTTRAGFFTLGLTEGLSGRADLNGDGVVFIHELDFYAARRVAQLSGDMQHPVTGRPAKLRPFPVSKP